MKIWIIVKLYNIIIKSANVDKGGGNKTLIHKLWIERFFFTPPLNSLEEQINVMSDKIINLEKEISTFKETSSWTIMFKCDEWGYEASSGTVLKMSHDHQSYAKYHNS